MVWAWIVGMRDELGGGMQMGINWDNHNRIYNKKQSICLRNFMALLAKI